MLSARDLLHEACEIAKRMEAAMRRHGAIVGDEDPCATERATLAVAQEVDQIAQAAAALTSAGLEIAQMNLMECEANN